MQKVPKNFLNNFHFHHNKEKVSGVGIVEMSEQIFPLVREIQEKTNKELNLS